MAGYDYDLFVIGAGSGGVRAARMSASYGARVAVAEERFMGGTCVNVGCIPKKLFAYGAHYREDAEDAAAFGLTFAEPALHWPTLIANKNKEIERLNGIYRRILGNNDVRIYESRATFADAHTLDVGGERVTAETVLVATGGRPQRPTIPGGEHAITSEEAFFLAGPARPGADRGRRLYRGRVRGDLQRLRVRGDPGLSRSALHARLRHRHPHPPRRGNGKEGGRHPLAHHGGADRPDGRRARRGAVFRRDRRRGPGAVRDRPGAQRREHGARGGGRRNAGERRDRDRRAVPHQRRQRLRARRRDRPAAAHPRRHRGSHGARRQPL